MARMSLEPHVEPIGLSPEIHRTSRRYLWSLIAGGVLLVAGLLIALRWTGNLG